MGWVQAAGSGAEILEGIFVTSSDLKPTVPLEIFSSTDSCTRGSRSLPSP